MSQQYEEGSKRPKRRKSVSALTSKKLFQEVENHCPFCGVADVAVLEIHHIDEDPSNNEFENLIVVCGNCHSKITREEISRADVNAKKSELFSTNMTTSRRKEIRPVQLVTVNAGSVSSSIIANTVTFGNKRSPRMQYPGNSIGADTIKKGYVDYLIKRYFDFRKVDASYGSFRPFSHAEIHTSIQSRFKAKTFFIISSRFEELCNYIKDRINKTIQGKRNRAQDTSNYKSFEDYKTEQLQQDKKI